MPDRKSPGSGRRGLLARVIERRQTEADAALESTSEAAEPEATASGGDAERIAALEARLEHLEALVEGLQDAFHSASVRHERDVEDLQEKTEAPEIARSLAENARQRRI